MDFVSDLVATLELNSINNIDKMNASNKMVDKYSSELKDIDKWVDTLKDSSNDYYHNAYVAWKKPSPESRDYKLIGSLVASYYKNLQRQSQAGNFTRLGNAGDKITFTVKSARVLYSKGAYGYHSPETLVWKLVDENGNNIIWSTTNSIDVGDKITATIQNPEQEYKGEKQTVITRGKIVN